MFLHEATVAGSVATKHLLNEEVCIGGAAVNSADSLGFSLFFGLIRYESDALPL